MKVSVHLAHSALVCQLPPGLVPAVCSVGRLVVSKKLPFFRIPESVSELCLRSFLPVGELRLELRPVVVEILG